MSFFRIIFSFSALGVLILINGACAHKPITGASLKAYTFRLKPGQDLKIELQNFAKLEHLKAASLDTAVGSLNKVSLRFANEKESKTISGFHEIVSLTGTLSEESMHVHMAASNSKGQTVGGHLVEGNTIYTTCEITLFENENIEFLRELDPTYGYNELVVKKRPVK